MYEGIPCKKCSGTLRYVSNRGCVPCKRKEAQGFRDKNKEHISVRDKEYRKKIKEGTYERQFSTAPKGRARYWANKEKINAAGRRYYQKNKAASVERVARRRAAKLNATPKWLTKEDKKRISDIYKLRELCSRLDNVEYHVDHVIPLQGENVCGLHVPENLRVVLAEYNLAKNNKFSI